MDTGDEGDLDDLRVAARDYERTLAEGDTAGAAGWFSSDATVTRFGPDGFQRGDREVTAMRMSSAPMPEATWVYEDVRRLGPSTALHLALLHRGGVEVQRTQVWQREADGWRISHAHVSRRAIDGEGS